MMYPSAGARPTIKKIIRHLAFSDDVRSAVSTTSDERIKSVLCFEIAPDYRGKVLQPLC